MSPELANHKISFYDTEKRGTLRSFNYPRNKPCPCGSGKKYKNCHQSDLESKNQFRVKSNKNENR